MTDELTLADLADKSGIPARTIRFYIARGILDGPLKGGRAASYSGDHLKRLQAIQKLQARGLTLTEITRTLAVGVTGEPCSAKGALPVAANWWHYPLDEDITVMVRSDASPWRLRQIQNVLAEMKAKLDTNEEKSDARNKRR